MQGVGVFSVLEKSKRTVFAITANALAVLISTLGCFVSFIIEKKAFNDWCIGSSANYVKDVYIEYNVNSTASTLSTLNSTLTNTMDAYNCERLFQDEVKWSFLCMIIMYVVYIHWILIIAARTSYNFYRKPPMPPLSSEFSNIAPSKNLKNKINIFNNMRPAKSIWQDLLVHRQYDEFEKGNIERNLIQEPFNDIIVPTDTQDMAPQMSPILTQSDGNIPYHSDGTVSS
ncbi:hypothetical protein BD408DRAFT_429098 [Parasitella parasitica]|nr:hypothetical protein BD408DRAFT_429098 [Parasitella parasitica]